MQLTYRGIAYTLDSSLPAVSERFTGQYRGTETVIQSASELPSQPFYNLTYRGAQYRPNAAPGWTGEKAIAL